MKRKLARIIALTLITAVLFSFAIPVASATSTIDSTPSPFVDVPIDSVAFTAILWANTNGIVKGTAEGLFLPEYNMTRAQYAVVLWRYEGSPAARSPGRFIDVPTTSPAYRAITWANEKGIVTGTGNTFLPEDNMTRAQMALMMFRYHGGAGLGIPVPGDAIDGFTDKADVPAPANEAMRWAVSNGLITGRGNQLLPNDYITREQVVLILFRYNNMFKPAPTPPPVTTRDKAVEYLKEAYADSIRDKINLDPFGVKRTMQNIGFSYDDIVYAINNSGIDWNRQAVEWAKQLAAKQAVSPNLIRWDLKEVHGFNGTQASYAVNNSGINWNSMALDWAKAQLVGATGMSRTALMNAMIQDGYTNAQAINAVNNCGANWNSMAVGAARNILHDMPGISRTSLINMLMGEGFTNSQAIYAANYVGK